MRILYQNERQFINVNEFKKLYFEGMGRAKAKDYINLGLKEWLPLLNAKIILTI